MCVGKSLDWFICPRGVPRFSLLTPRAKMHFLKAFLFLLPVACASRIPSCNDAVKVGDHPPLSKKCSSASIENNWLYAKCDVGADVMTFGLQLNWFIALNPDHKIVFQKE